MKETGLGQEGYRKGTGRGQQLGRNRTWRRQEQERKKKGKEGGKNQIKNILPLNIRLLVYNALVRPHIEYGIITWGA